MRAEQNPNDDDEKNRNTLTKQESMTRTNETMKDTPVLFQAKIKIISPPMEEGKLWTPKEVTSSTSKSDTRHQEE